MVAEHHLAERKDKVPGLGTAEEKQVYSYHLPKMEDWVAEEDQWDSFPAHSTPTMVHAAHPVTTEVPPGFDGTTNWFRYADAVEEWCDLTKVEARRRGPAVAARLTGRAEIYKERLDRDRLKDPETGVDYLLATLRPYFVKGSPVCVLVPLLPVAEV